MESEGSGGRKLGGIHMVLGQSVVGKAEGLDVGQDSLLCFGEVELRKRKPPDEASR